MRDRWRARAGRLAAAARACVAQRASIVTSRTARASVMMRERATGAVRRLRLPALCRTIRQPVRKREIRHAVCRRSVVCNSCAWSAARRARVGPDLAQPQHPRHRAVPGRRRGRYRGAPRQPEARRGARPARGDRESRRRERHARRGRRDQIAAGRLHDPHHHWRLHHRPVADAGDDLRSVQGPDPRHPHRRRAAAAAHASGQRACFGQGPDCASQGRARQARLRLAGPRHHQPDRGRVARARGRHQAAARALSRRRGDGERSRRRRHRARRDDAKLRAGDDRRGQDQGAVDPEPRAAVVPEGMADHDRQRAERRCRA